MTSRLITGTGWTIQQLDETPWPVVADLLDYWSTRPPTHEGVFMIAKGLLEIEEEKEPEAQAPFCPMTLEERLENERRFNNPSQDQRRDQGAAGWA